MRTYDLESTLLTDFNRLMPDFFGKTKHILKSELTVGNSTADLVALTYSKVNWPVQIASLSIKECVLLSILRRQGSLCLDELAAMSGENVRSLIVGPLSRIEEWGLVRRCRDGRMALSNGKRKTYRIISFEAKLTKWKQALRQAINYKRFSNKSYVVLPESSGHNAYRNRMVFEESGIGLVTMTDSGIKQLVPPKEHNDHDWRREYVFSRIIGSD